MKVYKWFFLLTVLPAAAVDDAALSMLIRAQTDFDRVGASALPDVRDTTRCTQSQAVVLPMTRPADLPVVRFRKGWCELLGATLVDSQAGYRQAAQDFAHALAESPNRAPEPVSAGLQVLSGIARLRAGAEPQVLPDIRAGFESAVATQACPASVMPVRLCQELVSTARLWLGWMSLREGKLDDAKRMFQDFPEMGWLTWTEGRRALESRRYGEAAAAMAKAVERWNAEIKYPKGGTAHLLGPKPDRLEAIADLGSTRYLAGDYTGAVQSLDAAVKGRPTDARSIFVRGLAREALGQQEAALSDYQIASRTAFANPNLPAAAAQAHLYRGVWHFRQKAWQRAESSFASALMADAGPYRAEIIAWRHLAAVAGGACESSAAELRRALPAASGFFPRAEAEAQLAACSQPATVSRRE
ncbi:MAG TPA: hypothetical protein VN442_26225 [Bryobacteraceae bacterium]|nr:hypothetical protein [Bryobacteraceae bacterium]